MKEATQQFIELVHENRKLSLEDSKLFFQQMLEYRDEDVQRLLCQHDLFFLGWVVCNKTWFDHPWIYDRIREFEAEPHGYLDLWPRGHCKSHIVTFTYTIQTIINNVNSTTAILSYNRNIARSFGRAIGAEMTGNKHLINLFPWIFFDKESKYPQYSLQDGITVPRDIKTQEATIEFVGLVEASPIGKHYTHMCFDDMVHKDFVSTEEQRRKCDDGWRYSSSLGQETTEKRYVGTRYHSNDTYQLMMNTESVKIRRREATDDGKETGNPVFFKRDYLLEKRRESGPYIFACQYLLNPIAEELHRFKEEWLRFHQSQTPDTWNYYVIVDPSSGKKSKRSDYTAMWVVASGPDKNYYVVDGIWDRINNTQKWRYLKEFVYLYEPIRVGYEEYGMQSDIEFMRREMKLEGYHFNIVPMGGGENKIRDRIAALVPLFEFGRIYLPLRILKQNSRNETYDMIKEFIDREYSEFPLPTHDDMLDCLARILDTNLAITFPPLTKKNKRTITGEMIPESMKPKRKKYNPWEIPVN